MTSTDVLVVVLGFVSVLLAGAALARTFLGPDPDYWDPADPPPWRHR